MANFIQYSIPTMTMARYCIPLHIMLGIQYELVILPYNTITVQYNTILLHIVLVRIQYSTMVIHWTQQSAFLCKNCITQYLISGYIGSCGQFYLSIHVTYPWTGNGRTAICCHTWILYSTDINAIWQWVCN